MLKNQKTTIIWQGRVATNLQFVKIPKKTFPFYLLLFWLDSFSQEMDKDVKLSVILPSKCGFLSPKCTQEGEPYLQLAASRLQPLPMVVVVFSCSVQCTLDSWPTHGPQHTRFPCHSPSSGACSNSCPLSWWCHPTISSSVVPFSCLQSVSALGSFSNESVLRIRWPKYWSFSFSISPSNEYSGLISFKIDWLDLLAIQRDSRESSPTPQFKSVNSSVLSFLHSPTLTSIHDYWQTIALTRWTYIQMNKLRLREVK